MIRKFSLNLALVALASACTSQAGEPVQLEARIATPDLCTGLAIAQVHARGSEVIVVSHVPAAPEGRVCAAAIGEAADSVTVTLPRPTSVTHYVLGKHWCWERPGAEQGYFYPASRQAVDAQLSGYTQVYQRSPVPEAAEVDPQACAASE